MRFAPLFYVCTLLALAMPASASVSSDDFNAVSLNTGVWTVSDPRGDGSVSLNGTQMLMTVPAGVSHDVWTSGNYALAAYQSTGDIDFDVALKFESAPDTRFQLQGLLVRESADTFIRFDFYSDGNKLRVFRAIFNNGSVNGTKNKVISTSAELHLRVVRTGTNWLLYYSTDGASWDLFDTLSLSMTVADMGPFVGNAGPSPAMTAVVDYFFDQNNPIVPEDGVADNDPPVISGLTLTPASDRILAEWTTNEAATSTLSVYEGGTLVTQVSSANPATSHNLIATGLSANTAYSVTIESTDLSGNLTSDSGHAVSTTGAASDEPVIDVWYGDIQNFGDHGQPQNWVNILGNVQDTDGVVAMSYTLNGGPSRSLNLGPGEGRRIHEAGDFNADIAWDDLQSGANYVQLSATDGLGYTAVKTVTVNKNSATLRPLPYTIDWTLETDIQDVAQVVDGHWIIDPATGGVRTAVTGYDRLIALGDMSYDNYSVLTEITVHSLNPNGFSHPSWGPGIGLLLRWVGHYNWENNQPYIGWNPMGGLPWMRWNSQGNFVQFVDGLGSVAFEDESQSIQVGTTYHMRVEVETTTSSHDYRMRFWEVGTSEPSSWNLNYSSTRGLSNGSLVLVAHEVDATFGPVTVEEISTSNGDTTPPVISNILANAGTTSATVSWSTDESTTGLVRYGTTTAYELGSVGSAQGTSHSVNLSGLSTGQTYHYQIEAQDSSSNVSTSTDRTFVTNSGGSGGGSLTSDEFDGSLDTNLWNVVDPVGDSTASASGGVLSLNVGGGTSHDVWGGVNNSLRVMQSASNSDFEVEVKFDSSPASRFQIQGILIEEDNDDLARFDYFHDGSNLRVFAATFVNGTANVRRNATVATANPLYLRVTRVGDQWTMFTSPNGNDWTQQVSFAHNMTVNSVGPFAGNAGSSPAFDAQVDYFRIDGESGGPDTTPPVISGVNVLPNESGAVISWSTDEPATATLRYGLSTSYEIGSQSTGSGTSHSVTLTGLDAGTTYHYQIEAEDAANNLATGSDATFATTTPDMVPPVISNIQTTPLANSATITWVTDEVASGTLVYGETTAYEGGSIAVSSGTNHSVEVTGLNADQLHHFAITMTDSSGNSAASGDQTFITDTASSGSGLQNDSFDGTALNPMWTINDVVGDGTVSVAGGSVSLAITDVDSHDLWSSGNDSLRITQMSSNTDFDVRAGFSSLPSSRYQIQGLLIEQDANDFIRFDTYHDGSKLRIFAASFVNGSPTVRRNIALNGVSGGVHLRVERVGDDWTGFYSTDGSNWVQYTSFSHGITVARVGPFAGNAGPDPSFTAVVDYIDSVE